MIQSAKLTRYGATFSIIAALAFWGLQPKDARADSLTFSAQFLENGVVMCTSSATPIASCESAQATGSLSGGTLGVEAGFPSGGLPLPNETGETSVEAIASAVDLYDFTSTVSNGTAVFKLTLNGGTSVSSTSASGFPNPPATCSSTPCFASAGIGIAANESFKGAPPGTTEDTLANIFNSGSTGAPSGPILIDVPVSDGIVDLSLILTADAECQELSALDVAEGASCSAIADYLDPLTITGVSIYDSNGNLVPDATLVSQSGFSLTSAATPEPSSIILLATGVLLLGLATRRLRGRISL